MHHFRSPWCWEDCETFGAGEIVEFSQAQHWQPETGGYLVANKKSQEDLRKYPEASCFVLRSVLDLFEVFLDLCST